MVFAHPHLLLVSPFFLLPGSAAIAAHQRKHLSWLYNIPTRHVCSPRQTSRLVAALPCPRGCFSFLLFAAFGPETTRATFSMAPRKRQQRTPGLAGSKKTLPADELDANTDLLQRKVKVVTDQQVM